MKSRKACGYLLYEIKYMSTCMDKNWMTFPMVDADRVVRQLEAGMAGSDSVLRQGEQI
ncbi:MULTISPECIES: hypothetical protein [unclassified Paenibacillus]|uniref:hypothetical protein n=1 Tax=unclassified Paenibacillus TaxID=185978 RepID=UPI0012FD8935|nr:MULTISPECIES: hypothetical protein [unclassified Paenibacillus]QID16054.1 hypothetical protein CIC07_25320 [Paenibacillus sp. RUD330]